MFTCIYPYHGHVKSSDVSMKRTSSPWSCLIALKDFNDLEGRRQYQIVEMTCITFAAIIRPIRHIVSGWLAPQAAFSLFPRPVASHVDQCVANLPLEDYIFDAESFMLIKSQRISGTASRHSPSRIHKVQPQTLRIKSLQTKLTNCHNHLEKAKFTK